MPVFFCAFRTVSPELKSYALGVLFLLLRLIGERFNIFTSSTLTSVPAPAPASAPASAAAQQLCVSALCVHVMSSVTLQICRVTELSPQIKSNSPHCLCRYKANLISNWYVFAPLTSCLSPIPSCSRFHSSPSDLWHGYRLHLSLLEHRLW